MKTLRKLTADKKETKEERCPVCEMPLEDSEVCYFCDWTRNVREEDKA